MRLASEQLVACAHHHKTLISGGGCKEEMSANRDSRGGAVQHCRVRKLFACAHGVHRHTTFSPTS